MRASSVSGRPSLVLVAMAFAACSDSDGGAGEEHDANDADAGVIGDVGLDTEDGSGRDDATDVADSADTSDAGDAGDGPIFRCLLECGAHGVCQIADAVQFCNCDEGWEGDACARCASGQDNDHDGVCSPACGDEGAPDCGEAYCFDETGTAACGCPRGYNLDETGLRCTFGPWPLDGEFEGSGVWLLEGGAVAWPDYEFVDVNPGAVRVATSDTCVSPVQISQQIPFSGVDWSRPYSSLVLWSCFEDGLSPMCPRPSLWVNGRAVWVGDGFHTGYLPGLEGTSGCLSPALAARDLDYRIVPTVGRATFDECGAGTTLLLSASIDQEPADSLCPTELGVPDGDFEGRDPLGSAVWALSQGDVEVIESIGNQMLAIRGRDCVQSFVRRQIAIPDMAGPALVFDVEVPEGTRLDVEDFRTMRQFGFGPGSDSVVICLDAAVEQSHADLQLMRAFTSAACDDPAVGPILIDNMRVESIDACVNHNGIVGGSLDDVGRTAWRLRASNGPTNTATSTFVEATVDEWKWAASTSWRSGYMSLATWLGGNNVEPGSAIRFAYRTVGDEGTVAVNLGQTLIPLSLAEEWTTAEFCLEPFFPPASLYFVLQASSLYATGFEVGQPLESVFGVEADNFEIVRGSDACE